MGKGATPAEIPADPSPKWHENALRVREYLLRNNKIGNFGHRSHVRYINLRTQEMFDNLVNLYAQMFMSQWSHAYTEFMDIFPPPPGLSPEIYVARCYISMWFIDLYVSNQKAIKKHSSFALDALAERYQEQLVPVTNEYDNYLTLVNDSIRPTHLKNAIHSAEYIPIIADSINANNPNPFGINNFTPERELFHGFTRIMKRSHWRFASLSSNASGRPFWLFDWHTKDRACSWFPREGNYDFDDVTLAYILGTACTPNLGSRDVDDWQYFAEGVIPQYPNPKRYDRVMERRFYGSYEVRTMEIDPDFSLGRMLAPILAEMNPEMAAIVAERGIRPTKKLWKKGKSDDADIAITTIELRALGEEAQGIDQTTPRFRLIDWVYYCCNTRKMDDHTRIEALSIVSFG